MLQDSTNEGEEGDSVFRFFNSFERNIQQNDELRKKLKNYFNGNLTTKASFAEIFNTNDEIRIKTETSIERLVLSQEIIKQADSITGVVNHYMAYSVPNTFSQVINLNTLSSALYESAMSEKSSILIELKVNRELFKSEPYMGYMGVKTDTQVVTSFLVPDVGTKAHVEYFYYDEIDIEFSSLNNYLFHQLSNCLTMMAMRGKYSYATHSSSTHTVKSTNTLSLPCLIKLVENDKLLTALSYFHDLHNSRLRLGDQRALLLMYDWLNQINNCTDANVNITATSCANNDTKQLNQEKMFEEIKKELVTKEQLLAKMIMSNPNHYDQYTHFYINDCTMSERDIKNIGTWLIYSKAKLFAWHLNQEDTKKIGLKATKVGTIPRLNNLNIYLILK